MQENLDPQAPPAPQAPQLPPPPPAVRIAAGPAHEAQTLALPRNVQEIEGLRSRRSALADQLDRAFDRRGSVVRQLEAASGAERAGLEQRLTGLDQRIVEIEADIAATERALTNAPIAVLGAAEQAEEAARLAREANEPPIDEEVIGIMGVIGMVMLFPIAIAHARRIWRRPPAPRALPVATEGRLERIEQAVEAIAVEVERVSEGQRFVTKLLSETRQPPLSLPADN